MISERRYSIGELAELTGVSRRTIHFYAQRGLIPRPLGGGRGHYYTEEHVSRLSAVRVLQLGGLSLDRIAAKLSGQETVEARPESAAEAAVTSPPPVSLWQRLVIAPGVELQLEGGAHRIPPAKIERISRAVAEILGGAGAGDDEHAAGSAAKEDSHETDEHRS